LTNIGAGKIERKKWGEMLKKKLGKNVKILHTNSIKALNSSEMNLLVVATSDPVNKN